MPHPYIKASDRCPPPLRALRRSSPLDQALIWVPGEQRQEERVYALKGLMVSRLCSPAGGLNANVRAARLRLPTWPLCCQGPAPARLLLSSPGPPAPVCPQSSPLQALTEGRGVSEPSPGQLRGPELARKARPLLTHSAGPLGTPGTTAWSGRPP